MRLTDTNLRGFLAIVGVLLIGIYLGQHIRRFETYLAVLACVALAIVAWWAFYVAFQKPSRTETQRLYSTIARQTGARSGRSFIANIDGLVAPRRFAVQRSTETMAIAQHEINGSLARIYVVHSCGYVHKTVRSVDATTIVRHRPKLCLSHIVHHVWAFVPVHVNEIRKIADQYELT